MRISTQNNEEPHSFVINDFTSHNYEQFELVFGIFSCQHDSELLLKDKVLLFMVCVKGMQDFLLSELRTDIIHIMRYL